MRLPFNSMILAAGHYRNTQGIYIAGAGINLIFSVLAVNKWGLIGVAMGTIAAMLYQVLHMGYYVIRHLEVHSFGRSMKQCLFDGITIVLILCATGGISATEPTWWGWILLAVKHVAVIAGCILVTNFVFYREQSKQMVNKIWKKKA